MVPDGRERLRALRGALSQVDRQQALDQLLRRLAGTADNRELLARLGAAARI